jgi:hypothetical protein
MLSDLLGGNSLGEIVVVQLVAPSVGLWETSYHFLAELEEFHRKLCALLAAVVRLRSKVCELIKGEAA